MLKFKKINVLYLFVVLSCLQNKSVDEKEIKLMKKPIKIENTLREDSSQIVKKIFIAIEELNYDEFIKYMRACNRDEKGIGLLLKKETALDANGDTVLSIACKKGFFEAIRYMLICSEFKSIINNENSDGYTPLILAVRLIPYKTSTYEVTVKNKIELINLLIENGADIDFKDVNDHSIIWHAKYYTESIHELYLPKISKIVDGSKKEKAKQEMLQLTEPIIKLFKSHVFMSKNLFTETNNDVKDIFEFFIEKSVFKRLFSIFQDEIDKILIEDIKSKNLSEIFILLELFGANPNIAEIETGNTALHLACFKLNEDLDGDILKIIQLLYNERNIIIKDEEKLKKKLIWGHMDSKNKEGQTPIGLYLGYLKSQNFKLKQTKQPSHDYEASFLSIINHEKNIYRILLEKKIVKLSEDFGDLYLKEIFEIDCEDKKIKDLLIPFDIKTILIFKLEHYNEQFLLLNPGFKFSKETLYFENVGFQIFSRYQTKFIIEHMLDHVCKFESAGKEVISSQKSAELQLSTKSKSLWSEIFCILTKFSLQD